METTHRESAAAARSRIERGDGALALREALSGVPAADRDAWLDLVLGLGELPDDGPDLPRDCVPYLPCSADVLLRAVDHARVDRSDIFVDVGSGVGRAAALVHLLTGAPAIGIEIQPQLIRAARQLAANLNLARMPFVQGDAVELTRLIPIASVFFLYCPFGGPRLAKWLESVEPIARVKTIRICCVDLPLPPRAWFTREFTAGELAIYRSTP